jgi:hypothetical protein
MPKIIESHTEVIENSHGDITRTTNYTKRYEDEPNYIKLYLDTILHLKNLPKGYNSVLLGFLKEMSYAKHSNKSGGQIIYVNSTMKKNIAEELGVSIYRVSQALSNFVKREIFFRVDRGTYQVNAHIFGKGDWQDIKEIRMKIKFNADGHTIESEFESDDKCV